MGRQKKKHTTNKWTPLEDGAKEPLWLESVIALVYKRMLQVSSRIYTGPFAHVLLMPSSHDYLLAV